MSPATTPVTLKLPSAFASSQEKAVKAREKPRNERARKAASVWLVRTADRAPSRATSV